MVIYNTIHNIIIIIIFINTIVITYSNSNDNNNNNNDNSININHKGYQCKYTSNTNVCCRIHNLKGYYCFPRLIIAGSQKSGTTTLSALLTSLPGISFAKKKELHFFSKNANYDRGIEQYLKDFEPWIKLDSNNNNNNDIDFSKKSPIYVESTPFYIASPEACKRIASDLPNSTHLILLFREPVSRSYSEYQMKKRRVEQQNSFLSLMTIYQNEVFNCMNNPSSLKVETKKSDSLFSLYPKTKTTVEWTVIESCVPVNLKQHAHWEKFKSSINRTLNSKGGTRAAYEDVLTTCFFRPDDMDALRPVGRRRRKEGDGYRGGRQLLQNQMKVSENNRNIHYNTTDNARLIGHRRLSKPIFAKKSCMGKFAGETLKSMEDAFAKEVNDFKRCAKPFRNYQTDIEILDKVISRCINIQMGISGQYIYRSIYAAQLYRCHKYIPPSRITIISSETFDKDPLKVLSLISELIGLQLSPQTKQQLVNKNIDIDQVVTDSMNKNFPKFQNNSGWRYRSEYEPIPTEYHNIMTEFFKPYNKMLFEYMNILPINDYKEWSL